MSMKNVPEYASAEDYAYNMGLEEGYADALAQVTEVLRANDRYRRAHDLRVAEIRRLRRLVSIFGVWALSATTALFWWAVFKVVQS